jgi:hypothetical protein
MPNNSDEKEPTFDLPTANDDIYVNDGQTYDTTYYPKDDPEQVAEETADKAVKAASYPILPEIAKWFEDQIDNSSRNRNIRVEEIEINGVKFSRKVSIEAQLLAYQLLENLLTEKSHEFKDFAEGLE